MFIMNTLEKQIKAMEVPFVRKDLPKVHMYYTYTKINPCAYSIMKALNNREVPYAVFHKNIDRAGHDRITLHSFCSEPVWKEIIIDLYYLPSISVQIQKFYYKQISNGSADLVAGKFIGWLESQMYTRQ